MWKFFQWICTMFVLFFEYVGYYCEKQVEKQHEKKYQKYLKKIKGVILFIATRKNCRATFQAVRQCRQQKIQLEVTIEKQDNSKSRMVNIVGDVISIACFNECLSQIISKHVNE